MPKAYWIAHVSGDDPATYEAYRQLNTAAIVKYGGRFLVRGGTQDVVEGQMRPRCVVIEFADMKTARACYASPEYRAAMTLRQSGTLVDLAIVEGCEAT